MHVHITIQWPNPLNIFKSLFELCTMLGTHNKKQMRNGKFHHHSVWSRS